MAGKLTAREELAQRQREFTQDFERFAARVLTGEFSHLVVMFGGTTFIQDLRANRPIRLTNCLARLGIPVLFNFHRWRDTDYIPPYDGGLVFQSPTDQTPALLETLFPIDLGATRGVLVVSYPHPSVCRLINLANVSGWATLYDCRDDWEEFHKIGMANWYRSAVEKYVVNNCDLTCCVSRPLCDKLSQWTTTRPVRLLPNAYDTQFLGPGYVRRPASQITIGYFGHLTDRWFDWDALARIAAQRPAYRFEIIGHGAPQSPALPPNVLLLGPKSHAEINQIASAWHVAIIPFRIGRLADSVDPIKIYEYFALGLPVVAFRMPQIADYPYTQTVQTVEAFVTALDAAARQTPDPAVLADFLRHNTWEQRARQMLEWADEVLTDGRFEKSLRIPTTFR